jgi:hypothetical protein
MRFALRSTVRYRLVRLIVGLTVVGSVSMTAASGPSAHAAPIVCPCLSFYPHIFVTEASGLVTVTGASFTPGGLVYVKIIGVPGNDRAASDTFPLIDAYFPMRADGTDDPVFAVGASTFTYQTAITSQRCFWPVFSGAFPVDYVQVGQSTPDHTQVSAYDIGSQHWSNTWDLYPDCPAGWSPGVVHPLP